MVSQAASSPLPQEKKGPLVAALAVTVIVVVIGILVGLTKTVFRIFSGLGSNDLQDVKDEAEANAL